MFFGKGSSVLIPGFDSFLLRDANSTVSRLKWGTVTVLPMNLRGSWCTPPGANRYDRWLDSSKSMKRSMEKKTFLTVYTYLHICLTYLSGYVGHAIFGTYRKYLEDVRVGSLSYQLNCYNFEEGCSYLWSWYITTEYNTSNSWHYSCPRSVYCRSIAFLLVVWLFDINRFIRKIFTHIPYNRWDKSSRRMRIVLGTFTSSSTKFVDLSYYAQSCRDSMKALQPLVAKNARRSSSLCLRWQ